MVFSLVVYLVMATTGAAVANPRTCTLSKPVTFAPGVISGPAQDDDPTFSPGGKMVFFTRSNTKNDYILVSHRHKGAWTKPEIASFSGKWRDMEPAMAPNGTYLIFGSGRPEPVTHHRPDAYFHGKTYPGRGSNLWRVNRTGDGWSPPERLPDTINRNGTTFQPGVAANGNLYFSQVFGKSKRFHIYFSQFKNGTYGAPVPMPFTDPRWIDVGTVIAPDESFMIFNSGRPPSPKGLQYLFISFHKNGHWSKPRPLPQAVNHMAANYVQESRLGPDGHTLYFTSGYMVPPPAYQLSVEASQRYLQSMPWNNSNNNIWKIDPGPWLWCQASSTRSNVRMGKL